MQTLFNAILAFDNMKLAWDEVQDGGRTAGVDGWTAARFQRHWERHLWDMIADVRANRYKPSPLRVGIRHPSFGILKPLCGLKYGCVCHWCGNHTPILRDSETRQEPLALVANASLWESHPHPSRF